jgi:hypothetical protein
MALRIYERNTAMHERMMGVGFNAILIAPCLIAMRHGVEHTDEG